MLALKAPLPRQVFRPDMDIGEALKQATHVFIWHDATSKPLQPPYDGPFKVVERADRYFTVDVKGRQDTISVERLKPAHLDSAVDPPAPAVVPDPPSAPSHTPLPVMTSPSTLRTTRSGRHVHWPAHLADYFAH